MKTKKRIRSGKGVQIRRLLYISDSRLPSERANSIQVAKTCEALSKAGCDVTLLLPDRGETKEYTDADIWYYYNIKNRFKIVRLPVLDVKILNKSRIPHLWFFVSTGTFTLSILDYLRNNKDFDVIYTRHVLSVTLLTKLRILRNLPPIVHEAHSFSESRAEALSKVDGITTITKGLARLYSSIVSCPIAVVPDAVDLEAIQNAPSGHRARKILGLPSDKEIVAYTGQLYPWKGAQTLVQAAKKLPKTQFIIVGGSGRYLTNLKEKATENVYFTGQVPNREIPTYLSSADVFVLPNTKARISKEFTSPLKLFEYMAAGRPIVASDLPSLREILQDDSAFFFEPENPTSLTNAITQALSKEGKRRAKKAKEKAKEYTWDIRVERILTFLKYLVNSG